MLYIIYIALCTPDKESGCIIYKVYKPYKVYQHMYYIYVVIII